MIDLYTPSGIGDIYWVLQKLGRAANAAGEKFRIHTPPGQGAKFARGKFLEFIDCVESVQPDGMPYPDLVNHAETYEGLQPVMYCEANTWLESGQRLEHYMPAFETEFVLNWQIGLDSIRKASQHLDFSKKNVLIYTSGVQNNESLSTGPWKPSDWVDRVREIKGSGVHLVWVGAHYDSDILKACDMAHLFDRIMTDEPADVVVSALRMCDGFISYQSGLSCISTVESIPTLMLYFRKIEALSKTFHPVEANYEPVFFDEAPRFKSWVDSLELRQHEWRAPKKDYTFWVGENIETTERDWHLNPWVHEDQHNAIKHLKGHILEIGCGSGQLAARIENPYTGFDQSEELLELARRKNPGKVFFQGSVRDIQKSDVFTSPNVCAFGFLKHFRLSEWDGVFATLAANATETLTIEAPIVEGNDWEDLRHDFPHTFVTRERITRLAKDHGFTIEKETMNRSGEYIFNLKRTGV